MNKSMDESLSLRPWAKRQIPSLGNHGNCSTCSLDQCIVEVLKLELELVQIKPEKNKGPEKGETFGSRVWDMEQGWNCSVETGNILWEKLFFISPNIVALWKEKKIGLNLKIELFYNNWSYRKS